MLFCILIILTVYVIWTPGFGRAMVFIFKPNFSELTRGSVLEALGHSFFTLSLGMGAMLTYGSYMRKRTSIPRAAAVICVLDTVIAIMACIIMFSIIFSFDLDVIKIYEDYDRCERIYYGTEEVGEKRAAKERRTYELSQVPAVADAITPAGPAPLQMPFRTLCNFLMITAGDVEAALDRFPDFDRGRHAEQLPRLRRRAECAWRWITSFAPEDFRFVLKDAGSEPAILNEPERAAIVALRDEFVSRAGDHDERSIAEAIYRIADEVGVDRKRFFVIMYQALIGKERGPRLAGFLLTIGPERVAGILSAH